MVKLELGREVDDVGFDGASDGPDGEICTTVECTVDRIRGGAAAAVAITNRQRGLFLLTYMGYVAIYFARKPMSVVKPVLEETMGISRDALSMVDTSLLGAYAAGQLTLGAVAKVSGWGVYCHDFLLLPVASCCSERLLLVCRRSTQT